MLKVTDRDLDWLEEEFPNLYYEPNVQKIMGELDFWAAYDNASGKMTIGTNAKTAAYFLRDVFEIEICLGTLDENGWPKVYEVGRRHQKIAQKWNIALIDLHFYSDSSCCLGINLGVSRGFPLKAFFHERVIPFFYRLSYVDKFGIATSQRDLWPEYPHGDAGLMEYVMEISNIARSDPDRNDPCPCGSGKKYKKCHLDQVQHFKRLQNQTTPNPQLTRSIE